MNELTPTRVSCSPPWSDGDQDGQDYAVADEQAEEAAPRWRPVPVDSEVLAILERPPEYGEQIEMAFRRKEAELARCFERISVVDAMELHRRLRLRYPDDEVAEKFGRLVAVRRERLIAYLADARRREATSMWKRK